MPATRTYRAFTPEFLQCMRTRGDLPKDAVTRAWFRSHRGGIKGEFLTDLRNGRYVPEKYTAGFIEMLIENRDDTQFAASNKALGIFLADRGLDARLSTADVDRVLSHACTPVSHERPEKWTASFRARDFLRTSGAGGFLHLPIDYLIRHYTSRCRPRSAELAEAIRWMYVRAAQMTFPDGPSMPYTTAVQHAAEMIGTGIDEYIERASVWVEFNPWTVLRARHRRRDVAVTTVLPLKREAYDSVRAGERGGYTIGPDDLEYPSRHLLLEACAENPATLADGRSHHSFVMTACLSLQVAALMRYVPHSGDARCRWLSYAATPVNRDRLISSGFKATGCFLRGGRIEMLERELDLASGRGMRTLENYFLVLAGDACPLEPPF